MLIAANVTRRWSPSSRRGSPPRVSPSCSERSLQNLLFKSCASREVLEGLGTEGGTPNFSAIWVDAESRPHYR